jgi:hypothetical protein
VAGVGRYGNSAFVGTRFVGANDLRYQGTYVRRNFGSYGAFTPGWYGRHPGVWLAGGWAAGYAWRAASWGSCQSYLGYPVDTAPVYYDYGNTVVYQDGNVYHGDTLYATEGDYALQAQAIADAGKEAQPPPDENWQPLGVFGMVKGSETVSNDIFQLALNKDGVIRGNYYNATTDTTTPVYGSLDRKMQRVAWTIGDKKDRVFETGLYNLTLEQTTLLVHYGSDHTEQYNLFRIEQKEGEAAAPG